MKKYAVAAILLISPIFIGAGCINLNLGQTNNGSAPKSVTVKVQADFCKKQLSDAEAAIKNIAINAGDKKAYEVWKQVFFKTNGINEEFFRKYVFASVDSRGSNYYIRYYYKAGDVYLYASGDQIVILAGQLDHFQTSSVANLLANLLPPKTRGFNEPHPTLGNVPRFGINNFDWGSVTVTKLKFAADGKTPPVLVCQEFVDLLKTCRADIQPGDIAFKPALGSGWIMGFSENYFDLKAEGKMECAAAELSIFDKKLTCYNPIKCTAGITP